MGDYDLLLADFRVTGNDLTAGAQDAVDYARQTREHANRAKDKARRFVGTPAHAGLAEYAEAAERHAERAEKKAAEWMAAEKKDG